MSSFEIRSEQNEKSSTLYLSGVLNMQTSSKLMQAFKPLFASELTSLKIDMAKLEKMDSAGVATLIEGLRWGQQVDHEFMLQSVSQEFMALLKMYKLHDVFEVTHG